MCVSPNLEYLTNQSYLEYPYIISPRRTYLLNKQPTIHWNEIPGATSYKVSIMNGSEVHWQQEVVGTKVVYPGEPLLNSCILYSIKIESNNNLSSESVSDHPGWGFRVLDEELIYNLQTAIANIKQKSADELSALELVSLYMEYGLFTEAIEELERLANTKNQIAEVYCTLGELYSHVGLHWRAKEPFEKALIILETIGDVKGKIVVKVELAQVKAALETNNEANALLQEAQSDFETLADGDQQKEIQEILEGLISEDWQLIPFRTVAGCLNNCVPPIQGVQGEKKGLSRTCVPCDSL